MDDTTPLRNAQELLARFRHLTEQLREIEQRKARFRAHRRAYMKKYREERAARKGAELE